MKILESSIPSGLTEITTSTLLTTLHFGEIARVENMFEACRTKQKCVREEAIKRYFSCDQS